MSKPAADFYRSTPEAQRYVSQQAELEGIEAAVLAAALGKVADGGESLMTPAEQKCHAWYIEKLARFYRGTDEGKAIARQQFRDVMPSVEHLADDDFDQQLARSDAPMLVWFTTAPKARLMADWLERLAREQRDNVKVCLVTLDDRSSLQRRFVLGDKGPYLMIFWRQRLMGYRIAKELGEAGIEPWLAGHVQGYRRWRAAQERLDALLAAPAAEDA